MKWPLYLLALVVVLTSCKKIDYDAVFTIDAFKKEIESNPDVLKIIKLYSNDPRLPENIQTHIKQKLLDNSLECFSSNNNVQIQSFLEEIRQYLLFRVSNLPTSVICKVEPKMLYAHQLDMAQPSYITISGIDIDYEYIKPRYWRSNQVVDITSLYCEVSDNQMTIQLGGTNGLPIDDEANRIVIGKNDDIIIPIHQAQPNDLGLSYQVHVEKKGWVPLLPEGSWAGTKGEGLRIESFRAEMTDTSKCIIRYRVHQQDFGTSNWLRVGQPAGSTGKDKRLEAIALELVDCTNYRLEYQGHIENVGDTEWIKEGEWLGSIGRNQRLEALRIKILTKDSTSH